MATEKWGLHWEAGQKDDGTWMIFRVDPSTNDIVQTCAAAWVTIKPDAIDVELEILDQPPIAPTETRPDGTVVHNPSFRLETLRGLVTDLVIYGFLYPELKGKTFATLTFFDKKTGAMFKQFKNRKY